MKVYPDLGCNASFFATRSVRETSGSCAMTVTGMFKSVAAWLAVTTEAKIAF